MIEIFSHQNEPEIKEPKKSNTRVFNTKTQPLQGFMFTSTTKTAMGVVCHMIF
jgi:hypothetical protein